MRKISVLLRVIMGFALLGGVILGNTHAAGPQIAAGWNGTLGVIQDGHVVGAGNNYGGQLSVDSWTDIQQVALGSNHSLGVTAAGNVVVVGNSCSGECNDALWTDAIQVTAGKDFLAGLKVDGTVVTKWMDGYSTEPFTDIQQIAAGSYHLVGLKTDGSVVGIGGNADGQINVFSLTDIQQIAAGHDHTVALKTNGSVVGVGKNYAGQCNLSLWTDMIQVAAGQYHTVGLQSDGTVLAVGGNYAGQCNVSSWTDIVQIAAGSTHTVGLKADGTVVGVGTNYDGQTNVTAWNLGITASQPNQLTQTQISQLYVSAFGRASEGEGNTYWRTNQDDQVLVAQTMLATDAAKTYFGETLNDDKLFIEFIYKNTLGKTYEQDPDGINYWLEELSKGKSKGQVVSSIIDSVMDTKYMGVPAQVQFKNRVTVSNYTANKIGTIPDDTDLSVFAGFISDVTEEDSTLTAAIAAVDAF